MSRWVVVVLVGVLLSGCGQAARQAATSATRGPTTRTIGTPVPRAFAAPPSPGCRDPEGSGTPLAPRTVAPPSVPIPFFAATSGTLPPDGPAEVGGVRLPRGSRCLSYWATDVPVRDPARLARRLARAFAHTGLWPLVWESTEEDPDSYAYSVGQPAEANGLDVSRILHRRRLAAGSHGIGTGWFDPFRDFGSGSAVLLLVPANRPADVLSALGGFIATERFTDAQLTAVARSWEERFGAVVSMIGPATLDLTVEEPPLMDPSAARLLAREHNALEPDNSEDVGTLSRTLRLSHRWSFGWPD